jgi:hypothetical protein
MSRSLGKCNKQVRFIKLQSILFVWLGSASQSSITAMEKLDQVGGAVEVGNRHLMNPTADLFGVLSKSDNSIGSSITALFQRP